MKPYLEKFESILNAANRGFVRNAPKERSPVRLPIERSPILNVMSSRSESIQEEMSGEVSKGRLEETYRQLQEVVGMNVKDPIGRVVDQVSSAVKDQFGVEEDPDHSQTGEAVPLVASPSAAVVSVVVVSAVAPNEKNGGKGLGDGGAEKVSDGGGSLGLKQVVHDQGDKLEEEEGGSLKGGVVDQSNRDRSVGKRSLKPSSKVYSDDYVCGNRKTSTLGSADTALINYCRSWNSQSGSGPIMLQCDDEFARREDCHDVVHCRRKVRSQYVGVVSKIYNKEWAVKYEGHSKRIMLHPVYGMKLVIDMDTPQILAQVNTANL